MHLQLDISQLVSDSLSNFFGSLGMQPPDYPWLLKPEDKRFNISSKFEQLQSVSPPLPRSNRSIFCKTYHFRNGKMSHFGWVLGVFQLGDPRNPPPARETAVSPPPRLPFSVCSFYWSETLIGHFSLRSMTVIGNATVNPCAIRICQAAFIRLIRQKWTLALVRRYTESFTMKFKHRFGSKSKHVLLYFSKHFLTFKTIFILYYLFTIFNPY